MIELHVDGAIATATLDHAPVNALSPAWVERFGRVLDEVESGPVRVLRIRSVQPVFCAGADLVFMASHFESVDGRRGIIAFVSALQGLYARLESLPAVSIAQIEGPAMGGGLELALACDFRMICASARIGLPEIRLGLLPGAGGTQRLSRLAGPAVARRLILTARSVPADEALAAGICDWVAPAAEVDAACLAIATRIASFPADAIAANKRCLAAVADPARNGFTEELDNTAALLESPTTQLRVRAFLAGTSERG